jgi:hypothetical protein
LACHSVKNYFIITYNDLLYYTHKSVSHAV